MALYYAFLKMANNRKYCYKFMIDAVAIVIQN